jgi:hypothetical protein
MTTNNRRKTKNRGKDMITTNSSSSGTLVVGVYSKG